jgi:hypothetical protein
MDGIARRYPAMTADEQARVQRRMKDWAVLSADERKTAREKYKALQKVSPEQKESLVQKWQEYRQLPEEEKQRLREEAAKTKAQPKPGSRRPPPPPSVASQPILPGPQPTEGVNPTPAIASQTDAQQTSPDSSSAPPQP